MAVSGTCWERRIGFAVSAGWQITSRRRPTFRPVLLLAVVGLVLGWQVTLVATLFAAIAAVVTRGMFRILGSRGVFPWTGWLLVMAILVPCLAAAGLLPLASLARPNPALAALILVTSTVAILALSTTFAQLLPSNYHDRKARIFPWRSRPRQSP